MAKSSPRGADWQPAANVQFTAVPWRLMPVAEMHGREVVSGDGPAFWVGVPFDPWKRGDLVVVRVEHSAWTYGVGTERWHRWVVGRRGSTPSASSHWVDYGAGDSAAARMAYRLNRSDQLWRIPYEWRPAAEKLVGEEFETREALEAALYLTRCGRDVAA